MALCQISFFAPAIRQSTSMNVIIPEQVEDRGGPFPVYYLLHGLSDDHTAWCRRTSIERYVTGLPLIVVMPAAGRGFYTNSAIPPTLRWEDFIIQDVLGFIDRTFPTIRSRAGRVIGGLSMGGYGAVKLALKHPDLFCAANSHSGPLLGPFQRDANIPPKFVEADKIRELEALFGDQTTGSENDPTVLAKQCPQSQRPALHIDCGKSDFLLEQNRRFHAVLKELNYPHEYHENKGDHNWAYWDEHLQAVLQFHGKILGIKPAI